MSNRFPTRAALAVLCLAVPAAHAAPDQRIDPQQTQTCNEPPALADQALGDIHAQIRGKNLLPGSTRLTPGTDAATSTELDGVVLLHTDPVSFSFDDGTGWVTGSYEELIVQGSDNTCKTHVRLTMTSRCLVRVMFRNYRHPVGQKLVANYRLDLDPEEGGVPPHDAQRSQGLGRIIAFDLKKQVCGGALLPKDRQTRWLLLNTSAPAVGPRNSLVLVPPAGFSSEAYVVHVPVGP